MPDRVYSINWNNTEKLSYTYDDLGRLTDKNFGGFNVAYSYKNVSGEQTSTQIDSVTISGQSNADYSYIYDTVGNITSIYDGTYTIDYEYDDLNQLVRVNDERQSKSYTYTYVNGNITSKKEYAYTIGHLGAVTGTVDYTYGDSTWADLLTSYNGKDITYDEIGNPTSIGAEYYYKKMPRMI